MKTNIHVLLIALLLANNNIRIEDHSHDTRMIHCMCTRLKNNKILPKSLCSFNMYVSAVLAERCSVGAKYPHLLSTAVVTEISLWTRTKPMCSCVWVCYWVCMFLCVLHCNLSGWSWNGFFFTWLPFLLMTEAVAWGEESHLTVCNVRECLRCDKSVPSAPSPDVCPNNHVFWSYWQICWISFSAVCLTHFHREPPSATIVLSLAASEEMHQYHGQGEKGIIESHVFCISRTFLLHNRSSFKVLQPVKCKLWASCLLCALTQCWYFKHYFKMYVCLKVILSTEHNYFLTDDLMSQRGQLPIYNPL